LTVPLWRVYDRNFTHMAILAVQKLKKSFGERDLFTDVTFEIGVKDRIGLVGANGTGKTTLFRILQGEEPADGGSIYKSRETVIGCLEQTADVDLKRSLYETVLEVFQDLLKIEEELQTVTRLLVGAQEPELSRLIQRQQQLQDRYEQQGGLTCRSRTRAALLGLGFREGELSQPVGVLSGGQLKKAMLARVLLSGANLLLLDEPTNHLDIAAVEWLEGFLLSYPGAFIVISHDRYFLDKVTNTTLELSNARIFSTKGNYSTHVERRSTAQEIARRHYRNTQREIKRIYGIVEQQRRWNRERNIRTAESKLKQIERLKATLVEPEREEKGIRFTFSAKEPSGNEVLAGKNLKKSFGEKLLFQDTELLLRRNECVFLLGPNGCGKTTLLKMLMGKVPPDQGSTVLGARVEPAYYEQNMRSLNPANTVFEEIVNAYPKLTITQARNALAAFLFQGDTAVEKPISLLSGGEQARIQLLKLMLSGANLLLLDEPTNHLDIASREALENALEEYGGTLFVVTHDRYLVNRLADRVLYMTQDGLIESIGGYDDLVTLLSQQQNTAQQEQKTVHPKQNDYKAQKERQSAINRAKGALQRAEESVAQKEAEIAALEEKLAAVAADYVEAGKLSRSIEEQKRCLEERYAAWEQAEEALERLMEENKEED